MTDPLQQQILDLIDESAAGLTIRQFLRAVSADSDNQVLGALSALEEDMKISMDPEGRFTRRARRPKNTSAYGRSGYLSQHTRPGGVMTSEGHIPYYRHPSGWQLPVIIDDQGRPKRKNRRLVYALPGGGEYQPEDEQSIERKIRGRL